MAEQEYDKVHGKRFAVSLQAIRNLWQPTKEMRVIEIGWPGSFSALFTDAFGILPESTNFHLSYENRWKYLPSDEYDLVICMEILEHLNDPIEPDWDLDRCATFKEEGARTLLRECYRIIKPGGHFFLTTPNIASWHGIGLILAGASPMSYGPHTREYSFNYIIQNLLPPERYKIIRAWTEDVYSEIHPESEMRRMTDTKNMLQHRVDSRNRGETTFVWCEK